MQKSTRTRLFLTAMLMALAASSAGTFHAAISVAQPAAAPADEQSDPDAARLEAAKALVAAIGGGEQARATVENLKKAFAKRIVDIDWMSPVTKKQAHEKLAKFTTKIGYPDKWKDYSDLEIKPDDLVGNYMRAAEVEYKRQLEKLKGPIDRDEWFMTPQTVNAYYNPTMNEIVFPAAILQPPFFNLEADDAVNYGAIGGVIGHEISHGFDDKGSQYDGDGNLRNWWSEDDRS